MTRPQELAKNLRQLVVLFWVLGVLATLGYGVGIFSALSPGGERFVDSGVVLTLVVQLVAVWIGLAWMSLLAQGVAELLAPTN
jgi:hypothetical protein